MLRVVLDSNIWNELEKDPNVRRRIQRMCRDGDLQVVIPHTLLHELRDSPWCGVPDWFPTEQAADCVCVVGHSRVGAGRVGDGQVYSAHKGGSKQVADAVLADFASMDADVFVTNDKRARTRYRKGARRGLAMTYDEFVMEVLGVDSGFR